MPGQDLIGQLIVLAPSDAVNKQVSQEQSGEQRCRQGAGANCVAFAVQPPPMLNRSRMG